MLRSNLNFQKDIIKQMTVDNNLNSDGLVEQMRKETNNVYRLLEQRNKHIAFLEQKTKDTDKFVINPDVESIIEGLNEKIFSLQNDLLKKSNKLKALKLKRSIDIPVVKPTKIYNDLNSALLMKEVEVSRLIATKQEDNERLIRYEEYVDVSF